MRKSHFFLTLLSSVMLVVPTSESLIREVPREDFAIQKVEKEEDKEEKKKKANEQEKQAEEEKERENEKEKESRRNRNRKERENEKEKETEYHSHFDVTFVNYDGTILYHQIVPVGEDASYHGKTPTRKSRFGKSYRFVGWDKPLANIQCDMVFTAQYESYRDRQ